MANNVSAEQLVNAMDASLRDMAYQDIVRASIKGEAKLAGFILASCFLDAMAEFYSGPGRNKNRKNYIKFVTKFMPPSYDADKLYEDLRCGLVHSYAEGSNRDGPRNTYLFTDGNKAGTHLEVANSGKVILNLEDFISEVGQAYEDLKSEILSDSNVFRNAKRRFEEKGLMAVGVE